MNKKESIFLESPSDYIDYWDMHAIKEKIRELYMEANHDIDEEFVDDLIDWNDNIGINIDTISIKNFIKFLDETYSDNEILDKLVNTDVLLDFVDDAIYNYEVENKIN